MFTLHLWRPPLTGAARIASAILLLILSGTAAADPIDLTNAVIVVRGGNLPAGESAAATVLSEEIGKRTGTALAVSKTWPADGPVIAIALRNARGVDFPESLRGVEGPAAKPEGYAVLTEERDGRPVVWLVGADGPGTYFAAGHLLRKGHWRSGSFVLPEPIDAATAPAYPVRGHQLGYREHSNSYDAFDVARYDQYIRELALFGANAIEQIPFHDDRVSPNFPLPRREMNKRVSEICAKYDVQNWLWVPVGDLTDAAVRSAALAEHEQLFVDSPRVDALFFPGGDPGNNPPQLVMPYLEDLAKVLRRHHRNATIWISLQGFSDDDAEFVYKYIDDNTPVWLGGIVCGPSSPPIPDTRKRLHPDYGIRHYPDITHTVRSQYPTIWWDPAFSLTLGREPINPEPIRYADVHNFYAPYTVGSISYSDGVNDDVNKSVWSRRGWDSTEPVAEILLDYTRLFFGADVADQAAAGILALETNIRGPLATNGSVDGTYALWNDLHDRAPELAENWRWQMCQLRANYDVYTRHRLLYEQRLEKEANAILIENAKTDPDGAMTAAWAVLEKGETERINTDQYEHIVAIADSLYRLIGMQTSMERHKASGHQRGCVIDLIHYPLFNRWWLEDEFAKVRTMATPAEKSARLIELATWENPGPGNFYDDIGNIGGMPRRIEGETLITDPLSVRNPDNGFMWWDDGFSRQRVSWQSYTTRTLGLRYDGLDPAARYTIRATGMGTPILKTDGMTLTMNEPGPKEIGEIMTFNVPRAAYADGAMVLTWERPGEANLNWRQASRLTEVWLLKE